MRITPEIVGKELGVGATLVRNLMERGELKIGKVIKRSGTSTSYIIYPKALYEETGIKIDYEPAGEIKDFDYKKIAESIVDVVLERIKEGELSKQ